MSGAKGLWRYTWRGGGAIVAQHHDYGELWMQADLACGRYGWNSWGYDPTAPETQDFRVWLLSALTQGAGRCHPDYVVRKLCGGHPTEYLADETDQEVRRWVIEARRRGDLSKVSARATLSLWQEYAPQNHHEFALWSRDLRASDFRAHSPSDDGAVAIPIEDVCRVAPWGKRSFEQHMPALRLALESDLRATHVGKRP